MHKHSKKYYALKEMSKLKILDKKSEKSINSEREFLSKLNNPFIVNMHYAFQDSDNLYLVMDLMSGGDLRYHISLHKIFSEEQTRFFICGIIIALEYIHGNNVIHRDVKPENLVLDNKGYIRLTDFGIAKENLADNSSETSGTPGYMSPEVMKNLNHSFPVDFFALGIIGYEFMKGERPYNGKNRKEIKEQMAKQIVINSDNIAEGWSKESADFINKLLILEPEKRIGYKGINELKEHLWLKYYPWEMLYNKVLPSPFIPESKNNFDKLYCEISEEISQDTKLRYNEILNDKNYNDVFKKFYYNIDEINKNKSKNENNSKNKSKKEKNIINNIIKNNNKIEKNNKNNIKPNNIRNIAVKKRKIINSMDIEFSEKNRETFNSHYKPGNSLNYINKNNKNLNHNINNISGNVSNNVIYINFNVNNPNISGNLFKSYQDDYPKTDRVIKTYKNHAKNAYYKNKFLSNKNLIQKIGLNICKLIEPIHSIKNIKNCSINKSIIKNQIDKKTNNNISIYKIYNKSKANKKFNDSHNKTTLIESNFENSNRFSDLISYRKNKNSLILSKNEIDIKNISDSRNKTERESMNKIGKIKLTNSLKKYNFNKRMNISGIKNNNRSMRNKFLKNYSQYSKIKILKNILSRHSICKDKSIKTSRDYSNRNSNSKNNELSFNKTYLNHNNKNEKNVKDIKIKNIYININKFYSKNKRKNHDKSLDNYKSDIIIDTLNLKHEKNKTSSNLNDFIFNKKVVKNIKSNNNSNKKPKNFIFNKDNKYIINNEKHDMIKNKNNNYKTNNLSNSINDNNSKKKQKNYNKSMLINNFKISNKVNTKLKNNNKNEIVNNKIPKKIAKNNQIIFSYKQKVK